MNSSMPPGFSPLDEEPQIDLTPLIDCLFMLIIFFVVTMSFSRPVLEIVLPESRTAKVERSDRQLSVYVLADGTYRLNDKPVDLVEIEAALTATKNTVLNIHMAGEASFDKFVPLVDLAKEKNEGRFVISTQAKEK